MQTRPISVKADPRPSSVKSEKKMDMMTSPRLENQPRFDRQPERMQVDVKTAGKYSRDAQNEHILASMVAIFEAILIHKMHDFYKMLLCLMIVLLFYGVFKRY